MGLILTTSDFTGDWKVSQNSFSTGELDTYITRYEKKYLVDLLGAELYALFEADIDGSTKRPATPKFIDIFDPFQQDEDCGIISSEGIKFMLKGFIFFEYCRKQPVRNTVAGNVTNQSEISKDANPLTLFAKYNTAVDSFNAIQWYINENSADYEEYNGQNLDYSPGF